MPLKQIHASGSQIGHRPLQGGWLLGFKLFRGTWRASTQTKTSPASVLLGFLSASTSDCAWQSSLFLTCRRGSMVAWEPLWQNLTHVSIFLPTLARRLSTGRTSGVHEALNRYALLRALVTDVSFTSVTPVRPTGVMTGNSWQIAAHTAGSPGDSDKRCQQH